MLCVCVCVCVCVCTCVCVYLCLLGCRQRALEGLGHDAFDLEAGSVPHTHGAVPLHTVLGLTHTRAQPRQLILTHMQRGRGADELRPEVTWRRGREREREGERERERERERWGR